MARMSSRGESSKSKGPQYTALPLVSRTQHVRDQLVAAINRGDYAPGERLPSERELVELMGVSRVGVREAIRSLEAIGMVEVQHGRGCFVSSSPGERYASSFSRWVTSHGDEAFELLRVRGALDELAAELAATTGADHGDELRALNAAFAAVDPADMEALVAADVAFHDAVGEASGSPLLAGLLRDLHETFNESRRVTLHPSGRPAESAREHEAIITAIERGDAKRAKAAVSAHLRSVRDALTEFLETSDMEAEQ